MSNAIVFYTNPMSRGRIVRWMLEELGHPYETKVLQYGPEMKSPGYLAINPMGKVPAITHAGQVVTEAAAICAYLAEVFPEAGLKPAPEGLGAYYRWLFFSAGPVEAAITNRALGLEPPADKAATVGYGTYETARAALISAAAAANPYIAGPTFSAADVYVGSQIVWGLQFGTIDPDPALEAYAQRISGRDAYKRASAIDDALMAQSQP